MFMARAWSSWVVVKLCSEFPWLLSAWMMLVTAGYEQGIPLSVNNGIRIASHTFVDFRVYFQLSDLEVLQVSNPVSIDLNSGV